MTELLLIEAHLKRLRLPAVARHLPSILREANAGAMTYEQFLLTLLDHEVQQRDENVQQSRIRQARFPMLKTLEQFDFTAIPNLNKPRVLGLAQGEWVTRHENVILVGPNGTGKSHLAVALGVCACRQGRRVRFATASALVNELQEARHDYHLSRLEAAYQRYDVLVIDELGFVPLPRDGAELLFTVCANRYERRSTIVTTNLEFARWPEILGDQTMAGALVDRLTHQAHIVSVQGESYRLKQSLRRLAGEGTRRQPRSLPEAAGDADKSPEET